MPNNLYSCRGCRDDHKLCVYDDESQVCGRCLEAGKTAATCGLKINSKGLPRSAIGVSPVTPTTAARPRGVTDLRRFSDANHAGPSALGSNRVLFSNSDFSRIQLLTGTVSVLILVVRTWSFFLALEVVPQLSEPLTEEECSIRAIVSWLNHTFQTLLDGLSVSDRRLVEPLHIIRLLCGLAFHNGPPPKPTRNTRHRPRAEPMYMSALWTEFCEKNPTSEEIFACVINILSELDGGSVAYGLSKLEKKSDDELSQLYRQTSRVLNEIYQAYLSTRPRSPKTSTKSPIDVFPFWQIAYRNGHRRFARTFWLRISHQYPDFDVDLFGLSLTHWAVEAEDFTTLCQLRDQNPSVGHQKPDRLGLSVSPLQFAAVTNRRDSYFNLVLTRHRNIGAENMYLGMAVEAGAESVVELLTDSQTLVPLPLPYSGFILQAIVANQERIAESLSKLVCKNWFQNDSCWKDITELARYAERKGLTHLAWKLRKMTISEPTASDAFMCLSGEA